MAEINLKVCKYNTDANIKKLESEALNRTRFYSIHASEK